MLNELIDELEDRLRQIIREEIRNALSESNNKELITSDKLENLKDKSSSKEEFQPLLLAEDVAKMLGVATARIYELTRQRKANGFPVIVLGERQYRYSKEAILDWMKNQ